MPTRRTVQEYAVHPLGVPQGHHRGGARERVADHKLDPWPIARRLLVPIAIVAGVVFIGLAILYAVEPAGSLPLPDALGHEAGSSHHHASTPSPRCSWGIGCFIFAWFESGRAARA